MVAVRTVVLARVVARVALTLGQMEMAALVLVRVSAMGLRVLAQMAAVMAALALAQVAAVRRLACVPRRVQRRDAPSALGTAAAAALAAELTRSAVTVSWRWTMASLRRRRELLGCSSWVMRSTESSSARASTMQES
jgi:hypothetical protein